MTEEYVKLAKDCGASTYTNRHYPEKTFLTFSPESLERFITSIRTSALQSAADIVLRDKTPLVKTNYHVQYNNVIDTLAENILKL